MCIRVDVVGSSSGRDGTGVVCSTGYVVNTSGDVDADVVTECSYGGWIDLGCLKTVDGCPVE